jgi:hypothetical protein
MLLRGTIRSHFVAAEPIVAVALLTQQELDALGPSFQRAWPLDETTCFEGLLQAIDEADRALCGARGAEQDHPVKG